MAQYTVEDIEILRQKSGISYEEAVNLLEYHNGSLARALVDLEKNGKLKNAKGASSAGKTAHRGLHVLDFLYCLRVKVSKGDVPILNLSILFLALTLLFSPWPLIIGLVCSLLLGYRIRFERDSADFSGETLESVVKNAGKNMKDSVYHVVRDFSGASSGQNQKPENPEAGSSSYYDKAAGTRTEAPASGTTPVNVQFSEEGNVRVKEDRDGFHEADIQ